MGRLRIRPIGDILPTARKMLASFAVKNGRCCLNLAPRPALHSGLTIASGRQPEAMPTLFLQSPASSIPSPSPPVVDVASCRALKAVPSSIGSSSSHRVDDRHASQPFRASSTPMQWTNVVRSRRLQRYELPPPLQGLLCAARFGEVVDLLQGSESRR